MTSDFVFGVVIFVVVVGCDVLCVAAGDVVVVVVIDD